MPRAFRTLSVAAACAALLGACTSSEPETAGSPTPGPLASPTATAEVTPGTGATGAPGQDCPEPRILSAVVSPLPIRRGQPYAVIVRTRGDIASVRFEIEQIDSVTLRERAQEGDWRGSGTIGLQTRPGAGRAIVTATDDCATDVEFATFVRWT